MKLSKFQLAVFSLIAANIIWGAAPPIFKWALSDIHPYTLAFLRFFVPAMILLPFLGKRIKINPHDWFRIPLIGFFGITVSIFFFFKGLLQAPSINASLIFSSAPVFIMFFSFLFLKERPTKKLITGTLIGLFGVTLVLVVPFFRHRDLVAVGNFYYLLAMLSGVVAILLLKNVMKRNTAVAVTFWSFLIGSLGFIPFFIEEVKTHGFLSDLGANGYIGLIFGIFFASLIAYFLQTFALKILTASNVSIFTYIDPVVTLLVAAPLLGERPTAAFVIGSILVIVGIFRAEGRLHWHPLHLVLRKKQPSK